MPQFTKKTPTRSAETRSANYRPEGWVKPGTQLDLGTGKDPEYAYRWNRLFVHGAEIDHKSRDKRRKEGWRDVKAEELPDLADYVRPDLGGVIFKDGNVLQKLPKDFAQAYVTEYEQKALGMITADTKEYEGSSNRYVQKFSETGKQRVFRGELPPTA